MRAIPNTLILIILLVLYTNFIGVKWENNIPRERDFYKRIEWSIVHKSIVRNHFFSYSSLILFLFFCEGEDGKCVSGT